MWVVQRIVVEDHRITIEHVVPSGPIRLQPEHHAPAGPSCTAWSATAWSASSSLTKYRTTSWPCSSNGMPIKGWLSWTSKLGNGCCFRSAIFLAHPLSFKTQGENRAPFPHYTTCQEDMQKIRYLPAHRGHRIPIVQRKMR
jgi:hypothetical protein